MLLLHRQTIFPIWDKALCILQKEGSVWVYHYLSAGKSHDPVLSSQLPWVFYQTANYIKPGREFEGNPLFLWHQVQVAGWVQGILWGLKGNFLWKLSIYLCICMYTDCGNSGALHIFSGSQAISAVTQPSLGYS